MTLLAHVLVGGGLGFWRPFDASCPFHALTSQLITALSAHCACDMAQIVRDSALRERFLFFQLATTHTDTHTHTY